MSVAKTIELSGSSKKGVEAAVAKVVKRANKTLKNVQGVWVKDIKADVKKGKIVSWRVLCKVTFLLKA